MLPFPVIEYLDIFKAHGSHFGTSLITKSVYPLALETVEPAFGRDIAPAGFLRLIEQVMPYFSSFL